MKKLIGKEVIMRIISIAAMVAVLIVPAIGYKRLGAMDSVGYAGFFVANYFGYGLYILPFLVTRLDPVLLIIIGAFGSTIDEVFAWYIGKTSQHYEKKTKIHEKLDTYIRKYGVLTIFILGVAPTPGFVVTIAAFICGHFQIPFRKYFLAAFSGRLISRSLWTLGFLYASQFVSYF